MAEELSSAIEETSPIETDITETIVEPSVDYSVNEVASTSIETPDNIDDLYNDFVKPNNFFNTPEEFRTFIADPQNAKDFFNDAIAPNNLFNSEKDFNDYIGVQEPGKPSAVPSASVGGGSATKGRGVEQPSMSPQLSSEASLDNIEKTMQVYADGKGAFPETLSAADVKELRKQVPGGELPNVSDEEVARMLAGKSPRQVRIESINAIPDIKERKTEQARMYKDFSRETSLENQKIDQNLTALKEGMEQIKAEGINVYQQLQNPNIDPQTAAMLNEQLQQTQANYNQAASDYNIELNKYQKNARDIKTMLAAAQSNLNGLLPSSIWQPRSPSDVMAASAFNSTAPALLKTLGAIVDIFPSMVYGEDAKDSNSPVADALFNIADKITIDIGKYNPQANVSLMDDVNAANASQLFGSLLGSVAMTFGGNALGGLTGSQISAFSQVYGDVYKQGRDAGLTEAEAMYFALPTGLVAAYLGDKGVESLSGAFTRTSLKGIIKEGIKDLAEKRTPQMMMEFGQQVLTNTVKGSVKEGLQEGSEFVTEFGSKKGASLKEGVKFEDDLTLKGFKKGLGESVIGGAAGGGLLGPFFGARRNQAFADVVNKAARDPQAEVDFMSQLDASVVANDITPEQKQQMVEMLEKTKQAASTVPSVVESEPARAEATALVLEQQDLQEQIEQTNPAMAKPLKDRLDEVNNRLGEIAEGKNLPTEQIEASEQAPISEAQPTTEQAPQTLPEVTNEIAQLREQEQAENQAIDPNDEVAKKEIYDKYDEVITPLLEKEKELKAEEAQAPVAEEAKPQEKGEFSIQGTFDGLKQVLGNPANMIPDIVRADIEPKFSESNQNGKKVFTLTVPQTDDAGRAGYLAVSLVLPETTTKTIDDVKSALEEKVAEAQTAVKLSREKGFPLETIFKNRVSGEYTEQVTPTAEPQAPVAEQAKGEAVQVIALPPEIDSLDDNEIVSIKYETFDEIPESLKSKANKFGGKDVKYRKSILGIPVGKEFTSKTKEGYVVTALGSEIKDAARQNLGTQTEAVSEQAPQSFPAQEGAESAQEQEFKANPELEQIYRDLNAAVTKNVDKDTIRMLKANPTEAMVNKAMEELKKKGIIKVDCN
jgi:hypothetical protein